MILSWILLALASVTDADEEPVRADVVIVVGAEGLPEYGKEFASWAETWGDAAARGGANFELIAPSESNPAATGGDPAEQRDQLRDALTRHSEEEQREMWLVLLGHGTFDGRAARFNLAGPDITAEELNAWLEPLKRPMIVINCFSSSGTYLPILSKENRIVITATRSGHEHNFSRFGEFLAAAVADTDADRDKDGQTSLLEAYLAASERVEAFYSRDGRLATEHALIDDNGDKLGTPGDWFQGVRAVKSAEGAALPDGRRAHQVCLIPSDYERRIPLELRHARDELESRIFSWRDGKAMMSEEAYFVGLEPLLLEMAQLYERIDAEVQEDAAAAPPSAPSATGRPIPRR